MIMQVVGGSAAQSTIMSAFDALLGVTHSKGRDETL